MQEKYRSSSTTYLRLHSHVEPREKTQPSDLVFKQICWTRLILHLHKKIKHDFQAEVF